MSFNSLGLSEPLLKAIKVKGYSTPSEIQKKSIPLVLKRKDILASSQTGTGKTAGFILPILQILSQKNKIKKSPIKALVLTPTRELAAQIYENVLDYGAFLNIKSTVIFGGVNQKPQVSTLRQGVDILVATPGRLIDLHNQKVVNLKNIEILVLDEADRMLDMGFLRDIKKIISFIPSKRQNLLFSATFSKDIKKLATSILNNPVMVEATPENSTVEVIEQKIYRVDKSNKTSLLVKLIKDGNWSQALVFTRTKHGANNLCKKLIRNEISAAAIHGNKSQGARTKALLGFKKGEIGVLVATDIAARGLDIPLLPHVVNYELPNISEDYVHRIGRTGRAGASGEAISLVCKEELQYAKSIEKLLGYKLPSTIVKGFEPTNSLEHNPISKNKPNYSKNNNKSGLKRKSKNTNNSKKNYKN